MLIESFQRAADARGDDRNTAGHRLQDHNAERFDPRRQHEQIGIGEERRNVIDPTAKRHAIPDPEPRGQRLQRAAFGSVAADLQPERRTLRGRVRSRMQQNIEPLLVNEPAEGLDHAVRLSRRLGDCNRLHRTEMGNALDAIGRHAVLTQISLLIRRCRHEQVDGAVVFQLDHRVQHGQCRIAGGPCGLAAKRTGAAHVGLHHVRLESPQQATDRPPA